MQLSRWLHSDRKARFGSAPGTQRSNTSARSSNAAPKRFLSSKHKTPNLQIRSTTTSVTCRRMSRTAAILTERQHNMKPRETLLADVPYTVHDNGVVGSPD